MSWHADDAMLAAYAAGSLDEPHAYSVESHLLGCERCRAQTGVLVDSDRLASIWEEVQDRVDAPRAGVVERVLRALGVPDHVARLLASTPSLSLSWLLAVILVLAFGVIAAHQGPRGLFVFLAVAPLLPLAGVAAAYGPGVDPVYEVALASPLRSFRLLLIRATAVLTVTLALMALAAPALPTLDAFAVAWLLPSLALTLASLALSSFGSPLRTSAALALTWICTVGLAAAAAHDRLAAFRPEAQVAFALIAALAALVIVRRTEAFDTAGEM